jgi:hypothetical protein
MAETNPRDAEQDDEDSGETSSLTDILTDAKIASMFAGIAGIGIPRGLVRKAKRQDGRSST